MRGITWFLFGTHRRNSYVAHKFSPLSTTRTYRAVFGSRCSLTEHEAVRIKFGAFVCVCGYHGQHVLSKRCSLCQTDPCCTSVFANKNKRTGHATVWDYCRVVHAFPLETSLAFFSRADSFSPPSTARLLTNFVVPPMLTSDLFAYIAPACG